MILLFHASGYALLLNIMRNNYVFIILVFIFSYAGAQTRLDSLYGVLEDSTLHDSIRSNAFKEYIVEDYPHSPPDSVLNLAHRLFQYSRKEDYQRGMARALTFQGNAYFDEGEYPEAMAHYQTGLKISQEIGDKNGVVWFLFFIGNIYEIQEDLPKALDYYQRALKISEEIGDKDEIGLLVRIASIYSAQGNIPMALDYSQRFLKIQKERENKQGIARALNNIGLIYLWQGNYPKALDYLRRSLRIAEEIGAKWLIAWDLISIGQIYSDQGDYPKALSYYQQGLKIREEIGDKGSVAWTMYQLGAFNLKWGNYIKAITYCKKGFDHFKNSNNMFVQKVSCKCLFDAYKAQGNGSKALVYLEQIQVLDDSLQKKEIGVKLQRMEFALQVQEDSLNQVEKDLRLEIAHQAELQKKTEIKIWPLELVCSSSWLLVDIILDGVI